MSSSNVLLKVTGVSKRFSGLQALSKVDLQVRQGSIHAIIGPNGAGKSTLLNVLVGLIEADEGSVEFDGKPLRGAAPHHHPAGHRPRVPDTADLSGDDAGAERRHRRAR